MGAHAHDLDQFLTRDPKGQKVPEYLDRLGRTLSEKRKGIVGNIDYMLEHLEHMKRIVSAQQTYAKSGGVVECCSLEELVETALTISAVSLRESHIEIVRELEPLAPVLVDRHQLLQIVVNLISNAKHALEEREGDAKRVLRVAIRSAGERDVCIEVEDNGVGIAPEHMTKIFGTASRRAATVTAGLHNSANAAQTMSGRLTAHSEGPGRGARFVLQIPLQYAEEGRQLRHG